MLRQIIINDIKGSDTAPVNLPLFAKETLACGAQTQLHVLNHGRRIETINQNL